MIPPALMARLFGVLWVLLAGVLQVGAKPATDTGGPPVLAPVEVQVEGRKPARILLKAHGIQRSPVQFVIRREPEFGRVRLLKQVAGDTAEVEYVPPEDYLIKEDVFWFAGSNAQGFSSDVRARIQILDIGPRLEVPAVLDFEAVRAGQSKRLPVEVLNSGDRPFEGTVKATVPWEIEVGSQQVSLAAGERKPLWVVFKPLKAGATRGALQIGEGPSAVVSLLGEGREWIELDRDPLMFEWGDSRVQAATLTFSNPGEEPLELNLEASPPLEHPAQIRLDAGAVRSLSFQWSGSLVPGGWGTLLLQSQSGMRRVVVWSLDAVLAGLGPPLVLEGEGAAPSVRRTFTNTGGRVGTWRFRCTPPFFLGEAEALLKKLRAPAVVRSSGSVDPNRKGEVHAEIPGFVWDHNQNRYIPSRGSTKATAMALPESRQTPTAEPQGTRDTEWTRTLHPGESFDLLIAVGDKSASPKGVFFVSGPGQRHEEPLEVKAGQDREPPKMAAGRPLPVVAQMPLALPSPTQSMQAALPPPVAASLPTEAATSKPSALPRLFPQKARLPETASVTPPDILTESFLPGLFLEGFRVGHITSDSATLVFPAPPGVRPEHLVVRQGRFLEGEENGAVEWVPFSDSQRRGTLGGGQIEIHLRGLRPGTVNPIDLVGPPLADGRRDRIFVTQIETPPAPDLFSHRSPFAWLILVVAMGGAYLLRRRSVG